MPDLEQMVKRQKILADFGEFALLNDDLDDVLTEACRLVSEALGADLGTPRLRHRNEADRGVCTSA